MVIDTILQRHWGNTSEEKHGSRVATHRAGEHGLTGGSDSSKSPVRIASRGSLYQQRPAATAASKRNEEATVSVTLHIVSPCSVNARRIDVGTAGQELSFDT